VLDLLYAPGAMRAFGTQELVRRLDGVSVPLPAHAAALMPEVCACCDEPATHRQALSRADGASLLIGYCDECEEHQASAASRVLALSLSSVLLALACAAGLPLLAPQLGWFGLATAALVLSVLPFAALLLPVPDPSAPHVARGPAVFWGEGHALRCASARYAERVQVLNPTASAAQPCTLREGRGSPWFYAGPVLGVGAACLSFFVYHPLLRILNLGSVPVEVALDGRPLVTVDPTSNESAAAGALLRAPAGVHQLTLRSSIDGSALGNVSVDLHSGAVHLFAIGGEETCFWLETVGYGREQRTHPSYQPLPSETHFWVLPSGIDTWFAPNPQASNANATSSGGLLTALRQAPCAQAPQEARSDGTIGE